MARTIDHILATLPEGVPLIRAPVTSGKTLLDRVEEPHRVRRYGAGQRFRGARHLGRPDRRPDALCRP